MATNQRSSYLPQELVGEVLARLPVKSLVRFRSVRKEWFTLIGDPEFAKSQLQLSLPAGRIGIVYSPTDAYGIVSCVNADTERGFEIINFNVGEIVGDRFVIPVDSTNGLLLLQNDRIPNLERERHYYVCNPITKWYLKLPPFHRNNNAFYCCPPSFTYDSLNQKYKVVIILEFPSRRNEREISHKCMVLTVLGNKDNSSSSSRLSQWIERELDIPFTFQYIDDHGRYSINGAMYWMIQRRGLTKPCILQMILATEEFSLIDSPEKPIPPGGSPRYSLHQMKGSLCLAIYEFSNQLDLWVLNDAVKQAWSKEFSINPQLIIGCSGLTNFNVFYRPFFLTENPRPVITFTAIAAVHNELFVLHDLVTGQFKLERKNTWMSVTGHRVPYVNSLISF